MHTPPQFIISPGEILAEEYLSPLGLSQNALGKALGVPPRRINEIIHGIRSITPNTALRLARYFNTSPEFWLNMQLQHDLAVEREKLAAELTAIEPHPDIAA